MNAGNRYPAIGSRWRNTTNERSDDELWEVMKSGPKRVVVQRSGRVVNWTRGGFLRVFVEVFA